MATEAVLDRETIESTLQRIQSGELSPDEATCLLLGADRTFPAGAEPETRTAESLAQLIERLGVPPADIVDRWCDQLSEIALEYEAQNGHPIPPIDLHRCAISGDGKLQWEGRTAVAFPGKADLSSESRLHLDAFRTALVGADLAENGQDPGCHVPLETSLAEQTSNRAEGNTDARKPKSSDDASRHRSGPSPVRRILVITICCISAAAAGYVLIRTARDEPHATADNAEIGTAMSPVDVADAARLSQPDGQESSSAPPMAKLETLQTMEPISDLGGSTWEPAADAEPSFSLNDFLPPPANFLPSPDAPREHASSPAADALGKTIDPTGDPLSDTADEDSSDDESAPSESVQQTRRSKTMSVELPPPDQPDATITLSEHQPQSLTLEFPFDVSLSLAKLNASGWRIHDTRNQQPVAQLTTTADGLQLSWTTGASKSNNASALRHGRLQTDAGDTIFLRPAIEADPWKIRADQPDVMPTWDLRDPIPPRVARIAIDFELPEEIEEAWIEPIDSESPRRGRGLAVLTPADGESVALGLRIDFRCSRKISCRIRYAGRLDSSMPWQIVSVPLLRNFADQLTVQATLASNESQRLASVYETAGPTGRRLLRIKRQRNDQWAESIRIASRRLAELQALLAAVETEAALKIRVWADWPDTQQSLFTMSP